MFLLIVLISYALGMNACFDRIYCKMRPLDTDRVESEPRRLLIVNYCR